MLGRNQEIELLHAERKTLTCLTVGASSDGLCLRRSMLVLRVITFLDLYFTY